MEETLLPGLVQSLHLGSLETYTMAVISTASSQSLKNTSSSGKNFNIFHGSPTFPVSFHFVALLFFTDKLLTGVFINYLTSHLFLNLSNVSSTPITYQCPVTSISQNPAEKLEFSSYFNSQHYLTQSPWFLKHSFPLTSVATCSAGLLPVSLVML